MTTTTGTGPPAQAPAHNDEVIVDPRRRLLILAAMCVALVAVVASVSGLNVAQLIGGALIIETIFVLPGIGSLLVGSINGRDYAMVQGGVLLLATLFVVVNFLVDIAYTVLDPRIRTKSRG